MSAHRQSSLVGRSLGDYELSALHGGGPFGQVYLARHRNRDLPCAVKVFDPSRCSPALLQRSLKATSSAVVVPGSGACPIDDAVLDGPHPFFARELVGGESLESLIRRNQRLPWDIARPVFAALAASLSASHRAGVTHGNLKPTNVRLLGTLPGSQTVRLLDWGLHHGMESDNSGTRADFGFAVDHQAPEQLGGAPLTPPADLYAFGIMLFEAVTGARPFQGSANVVAMHHMRTPPPSPRSLVPDLPEELEVLLLQLLQKDPRRRPGSDALAQQLAGPPPSLPDEEDLDQPTELFHRPFPRPGGDMTEKRQAPITEINPRISLQPVGESTVVNTVQIQASSTRQAETVVLPAAAMPSEKNAVTLVIPGNTGPLLLDPDSGIHARQPTTEQTSISTNPSATIFVHKPPTGLSMPPQPPPTPEQPGWRRLLSRPWSFERKLIALNVLLGLMIVVGLGLFISHR